MLVQHILKDKPDGRVITVAPDMSVAEAVEILSANRIGALIVSRDGLHVAGILSERDVVRELGKHGPDCLAQPVARMMTATIVGCAREDSVDEVMRKMTEGRFRHMPVMQGSEMVGLISIGDVVKARLQELAMEKDALEGMIKGF